MCLTNHKQHKVFFFAQGTELHFSRAILSISTFFLTTFIKQFKGGFKVVCDCAVGCCVLWDRLGVEAALCGTWDVAWGMSVARVRGAAAAYGAITEVCGMCFLWSLGIFCFTQQSYNSHSEVLTMWIS